VKKFRIGLCYSGYAWQEVEAENARSAYYKAMAAANEDGHALVVTDWERWSDADEIRADE
jgi:hypothetical protein